MRVWKFLAIMHRLKLVLLFIFILVKVKVSARTESNAKPAFSKSLSHAVLAIIFSAGEECCYLYGSVPRNESSCVFEGRQTTLSFLMYNPHDSFTNFTVRWFKNADPTRAAASTEEITDIQNKNHLFYKIASITTLAVNCTTSPLHRTYSSCPYTTSPQTKRLLLV